jgi:HK97 gp10 family phage protein
MTTVAVTATMSGLIELNESLDKLSFQNKRRVLERVLLRRAQPIVQAAKDKAPYEYYDLERSIQATTTPPHNLMNARKAFGQVIAAGGTIGAARAAAKAYGANPPTVYIGPGRNPQSSLQEFGTSHHRAQPYLRPAWDQNSNAVLVGIAADIQQEINATAARVAKRAANKAAKTP